MKLNIAAFLLAVPSLVRGEANLRGDAQTAIEKEAGFGGPTDWMTRDLREEWKKTSRNKGYGEDLGQCHGALCGVWGDPHVITCDGLMYDCQTVGLMQLMKNHMFNIQGNFVDVGEEEHKKVKKWGKTHGASLTNDVVIEMFPNNTDAELRNKFPVVQIGYADLSRHDGTYFSEDGCVPWSTFSPVNMHGQGRTVMTLNECRTRCEDHDGCTKFSWWADHGCHINDNNQNMVNSNRAWSRALAGDLETDCGKPFELPPLKDDTEDHYHGIIGNRCPMLMHIDGQMVDLSRFRELDNGYMYGAEGDALTIKMVDNHKIEIEYELANGEHAAIHMFNRGKGPGELWSCHWNYHVCLPETDEDLFRSYGVGILGSPDGDTKNDWMSPDNEIYTYMSGDFGTGKHEKAFKYCTQNWCVSQADSKMVHSADRTYDDAKCLEQEYIDFSVNSTDCVLEADKIIEACEHVEPLMRYGCELDCCKGGCDEMFETADEAATAAVTTFRDDNEEDHAQYGIPNHDLCQDNTFYKTADNVCDSTNVVKLLKSKGNLDLPEDATVFYGLELDVEPHDGMAGKAVRFRINNFMDNAADIYVKHTKSVLNDFMDPVCDPMLATAAGCDTTAPSIEVACHDYDGIPAFAIVQVYVQSRKIPATDAAVDKCCTGSDDAGEAIAEANDGVAMFTFEIACDCPTVSTTGR